MNVNLHLHNGGDQNNDAISERPICEELGIELTYNYCDQSVLVLISKRP